MPMKNHYHTCLHHHRPVLTLPHVKDGVICAISYVVCDDHCPPTCSPIQLVSATSLSPHSIIWAQSSRCLIADASTTQLTAKDPFQRGAVNNSSTPHILNPSTYKQNMFKFKYSNTYQSFKYLWVRQDQSTFRTKHHYSQKEFSVPSVS